MDLIGTMCWPHAANRSSRSDRVKLISQSSSSAVMITSQIGSVMALVSRLSMAWASHDLAALRLVGTALPLQSVAGLRDVAGERVDVLAAQSLLDQRAHDRNVLGVGWHGVRGNHPAAFGRQLPGDIELVEVVISCQSEGCKGKLFLLGPDQLETTHLLQLFGQHSRVLLHVLHHVAVAGATVADEVVVLRQNHGRAGGEVQRKCGVGLAEVVLLEDEVSVEVGSLPEDQPPDARIHEPELVSRDIDRVHLLEAKVPFRMWVKERPDESTARAVHVQGDVEVAFRFDLKQ